MEVAAPHGAPGHAVPLRGHPGVDCVQNPLMQRSPASQQSALDLHLSPGLEHVPLGGMLEQTSAPASPFGSQ